MSLVDIPGSATDRPERIYFLVRFIIAFAKLLSRYQFTCSLVFRRLSVVYFMVFMEEAKQPGLKSLVLAVTFEELQMDMGWGQGSLVNGKLPHFWRRESSFYESRPAYTMS
jgi:hypothetical protein